MHLINSSERTEWLVRHNDAGISLVAGGQWGDEGKGKVSDILMDDPKAVGIRSNGGHNAGHTVVLPDGTEFDLHILPSGSVRPGRVNIITSGCVLGLDLPKISLEDKIAGDDRGDLIFRQNLSDLYLDDKKGGKKRCALIPELEQLLSKGVDVRAEPVKISAQTPMIGVHHILLDALDEEVRRATPGGRIIGSTGSGITRAYESQKSGNHFSLDTLLNRPDEYCQHLKEYWKPYACHFPNITIEELVALAREDHERLKGLQSDRQIEIIPDEKQYIENLRKSDHKMVGEMAQGALISEKYSPFGTASNPSIENFCAVTGIEPSDIANLFAVFKMPASSVGTRPQFLVYAENNILGSLRTKFREFGVSTGRPREIFRYSLPEFAKSLSLMIGDVIFPRDRVVPVFHRVDGINDFAELHGEEGLSVVTGWSYANQTSRILVGIHDLEESITPEAAMRNYPDRTTMGSDNVFAVTTGDLVQRRIHEDTSNAQPDNIPEGIDHLLELILQSMFTKNQIREIMLGFGPKRDDNCSYLV